MPELPEVETTVRGLRNLVGARIVAAELRDPRLSLPIDSLPGEHIQAIVRHGKYIEIRLCRGSLIIHLRMSGRLLRQCTTEENRYCRFRLRTDRGEIHFVNPRRLGTITYEKDGFHGRLGPDPLAETFVAGTLGEIASISSAPLKTVLLDQTRIAGLGNIYATEALWHAGLDPRRPASSLDDREVAALHASIRSTLEDAIAAMGSTLGDGVSDYRDPAGERGRFQPRLEAYRRAGEPCRRCGGTIERIVQAGRSTYLCTGCQN